MIDRTTYVATAPQLDGSLVFKYDLEGTLREVENRASIENADFLKFLATRMPFREAWFKAVVFQVKSEFCIKLSFEVIDVDLRFDTFWDFYDNKFGSKKKAKDLWDGKKPTEDGTKMEEADRLKSVKMLPRMKFHYKLKNIELPYMTTFLNQRRFENKF